MKKSLNLKKGDIILVLWTDAHSSYGWESRSERSLGEMVCLSVGLFVDADSNEIAISQTLSAENKGNTLTIPFCCIKNIIRLGVSKEADKMLRSVWSNV